MLKIQVFDEGSTIPVDDYSAFIALHQLLVKDGPMVDISELSSNTHLSLRCSPSSTDVTITIEN